MLSHNHTYADKPLEAKAIGFAITTIQGAATATEPAGRDDMMLRISWGGEGGINCLLTIHKNFCIVQSSLI